MSSSQLRYVYGSLLKQICEKIGVQPTQRNKEVVKAMLKKSFNIDTLAKRSDDTDFSYNDRIARFITHSSMLLASEFNILVDLPGEKDVDSMPMRDFLELIYTPYHDTGNN